MDLSELYRDIVETSPDGIWVLDLEGRTVYANPEIARLHRIDPGKLAGLTVFDTLDEDGRAQFRAHLDEVREGRLNEGPVEVQWVRSDGEILWVVCSETALLDDEGRPRALLHRYSDNTRHHELIASLEASEAALEDQVAQNNLMQAVASAANEATSLGEVLLQARDLVLLHDDWERARAFVPSADGTGQVEPFFPPGTDADADVGDPRAPLELALAQRAHDTGGMVWDDRRLTFAFPILLGTEVYAVVVITSAPPLYRFELIETMAGRVALQMARVAERERAQAQVARARDEAMEASRQKSEFLATMSHEIRTPLNGVIGLNDLLLRTALSPEQQRLASGVQVASRTLLRLINDILDFSKIEAGRLELERLDFEIRPLLEQVAGMLTEAARDKSLDLVISCHPDVPAVLSGDPTRLAQVVTNLVSNAVKFTERGGVVVRATAEEAEEDRLRLRVEVSDTGVGVPRSKRTQLFDPFTQGDSSTTRIYGGTGLGLAISSELVAAMGGTLEYAPNPGGGSIFSCSVVLDEGTEAFTDQSLDVQAREQLSGHRALVVTDDPVHAWVWAEQLTWWGLTVGSSSAAEGYDAVLFDHADVLELRAGDDRAVLAKPVLPSELRSVLLRLVAGVEPAPPDLGTGREEQPGKGRILVVEDNPVNQLVATGLLQALGYRTETADDGLAAIEAASTGGFDAILMDVQMPQMDGYTATRHIRENETGRHRCPIIAMTAAAVEGERERCLDAGMDDYLTKPVDAARLSETLDRWLARGASYAERLDLERLKELRELDDPEKGSYVDRAIANFLGSAEDHLATMADAAAAGDAELLRTVAHRMAGSALNLGAVGFGQGARDVEQQILNDAFDDAAAAMPDLAERLAADMEALRAYQREQFPARAG